MSLRDRVLGFARRVDRKIFRRSVALVDHMWEVRGELEDARSELAELRAAVTAFATAAEQERRETRAQFIIIRGAIEPGNGHGIES